MGRGLSVGGPGWGNSVGCAERKPLSGGRIHTTMGVSSMSFRSRGYKIALCLAAVFCLCGAGAMQRLLNADREQMGFGRMQPLHDASPVLQFTTVALGGFRGLIANALWIRATELQDDNKYFELAQLADWITKLQPHMPQVWCVEAWNMAYNISVKFKDPRDRWFWVQRGIQLLRDDGIRYNTNQTVIYRDLSWIYQHKIGANLDDAHMYYKLQLAEQMQQVFPDGHAHTNELLHPPNDVWRERVRKLETQYKIDPAIVALVEKDYGPLDWRLPGAYAVYYAELGLLHGAEKDRETVRRSIFQTMRETCFIGGALPAGITNVTPENFYLRPNLELIPTIVATYEKMIDAEKDPGQKESFINGRKNFIKEAIPLLYADAQQEKAAYWYNYLKKNFTHVFNPQDENLTVDQYVLKTLTEDMGETDQYKVVDGLLGLIESEYLCLVFGEDAKVANAHALIQRIWDHYENETHGLTPRLYIPPISNLQQLVLGDMLNPQTSRLSEQERAILRSRLDMSTGEVLPPSHAAIPLTNSVAPKILQ